MTSSSSKAANSLTNKEVENLMMTSSSPKLATSSSNNEVENLFLDSPRTKEVDEVSVTSSVDDESSLALLDPKHLARLMI